MAWQVFFGKKAQRNKSKLPKSVVKILATLAKELVTLGPVRGNWPNYGKLGPGRHHCHLKKGNPTYVAVWIEDKQGIKLIEVVYVGTHEKAPY